MIREVAAPATHPARPLEALAARPDWLLAPLDAERMAAALARHIPELRSGALRLGACEPGRLFLKERSGVWLGRCRIVVAEPGAAAAQEIALRVTLYAPTAELPPGLAAPPAAPLGSAEWSCYLPELRLLCAPAPPEQALAALADLTDPELARAMLAESLGTAQLDGCQPEIVNYKPGSRCTLRYQLSYAARAAAQDWPTTVIAKTYDDATGEQAYRGMVALWRTPLAQSAVVNIAEPLGYVPRYRLLLQSALPGDQPLLELFNATLRGGERDAWRRLEGVVRAAATGLAELHRSGAQTPDVALWETQLANLGALLQRLAVVAPAVVATIAPLVDAIAARARRAPADPLVPAHGSFDSEQILVAGDRVSFIDFDSFCMAEPAMDVAHFRAALMDSGMKLIDPATLADPRRCRAYLERLDALCASFLAAYAAHAPISRERLALWEAADYVRDVLHLWKKPKPEGAEATVALLRFHLQQLGMVT